MRSRHPSPPSFGRHAAVTALALAASLATPGPAAAQSAGFSPADYGKALLPTRQSTGDAAAYIEGNKGGAFEPVSELDANDPLAALARPIGRLDVVLRNARTGEEIGTSCTGALLAGDLVLTNHHCLPVEGELAPVKASILLDYLTLDGKAAKRFEIEPKPVEWSSRLDYAIGRAKGAPSAEFGTVRVASASAAGGSGRSLMVIHHPLGRPKVMSRFRCLAIKDQEAGPDLRHRCDTLGGSSGSLLFDGGSVGIALHKEGGLNPADPSSFNTATRMAALLDASPILTGLARAGAGSGEPAPSPGRGAGGAAPHEAASAGKPLDASQMNNILRGR